MSSSNRKKNHSRRVIALSATAQPTTIDYNFRPATYWNAKKRKLANITGTQRRLAAQRDLATRGRIDPGLLPDTTTGEKNFLGSIHPQLRSGEDLAPARRNETEIARMYLPTTVHAEVTSVRARWSGGRIYYRVVDEINCDMGFSYRTKPRSSKLPLTLGELIELMETVDLYDDKGKNLHWTGLVEPVWDMQHGNKSTKQEVYEFVEVSSVFYPQLAEAYKQRFELWAAQRKWPRDPDSENDWGDEEEDAEQEVIQ